MFHSIVRPISRWLCFPFAGVSCVFLPFIYLCGPSHVVALSLSGKLFNAIMQLLSSRLRVVFPYCFVVTQVSILCLISVDLQSRGLGRDSALMWLFLIEPECGRIF